MVKANLIQQRFYSLYPTPAKELTSPIFLFYNEKLSLKIPGELKADKNGQGKKIVFLLPFRDSNSMTKPMPMILPPNSSTISQTALVVLP